MDSSMGSTQATSAGKKKVCIVGGGTTGLVSLRRVVGSEGLTATLFEQKQDIGGLWQYNGEKVFKTSPRHLDKSKSPSEDPGQVTTMYDGLILNTPYPLVEFVDFQHPRNKYTYPSQEDMYHYLRNYVDHFKLWPHIQVNTAVVNIRPVDNPASKWEPGSPCQWIVETHNHEKDQVKSEVYDAVMICGGHNQYPQPPSPQIEGVDKFQGLVIHSKFFKNGAQFAGKRVVVVGLGPSTGDLALHISRHAQSVTLCHKFPLGYKFGCLPKNARETKCIKVVTEEGIVTEDDEFIACDAIILGTGYGIKFPYLHPACGVTVVQDKYVPDLYRHTVFSKRPTLSFLNLTYRTPEFIIVEIQARYVVSLLEGKVKLPPYAEMEATMKAVEQEKVDKGTPIGLWFEIGPFGTGCWQYFFKIAEEIGVREDWKHGAVLEYLWNTIIARIFGKLVLYRKDVLTVVEEGTHWQLKMHASPDFPETKEETVNLILNEQDWTLAVETVDPDG